MNEIKGEQNNGEIVPVHGQEYSILSRCQFFPNQSIDLMQSQ